MLKTALFIIDIQNDHFPGGKHPLVNPLEAAQKAYSQSNGFLLVKKKTDNGF